MRPAADDARAPAGAPAETATLQPGDTVRVAAVGDVHVAEDSVGLLRPKLERIAERADVLLLAGDLTHRGRPVEAKVLCGELRDLGIPVVAVLGNHDYHSDQEVELTEVLTEEGIRVLEGDTTTIDVRGTRVGVAGTKGFGGGFPGATASEFGEREQRDFSRLTRMLATGLEAALRSIADVDIRIALLHYAPVADTLAGEPPGIHAFLGSYLFAEAADHAGADLILHGHAHRGIREGRTPGGIPVRNVAMPVIGAAYDIFDFALATPVARRRASDGETGA